MEAEDLDLRKILSFSPKGGIMQFMGRRALLIDTVAMGLLRKELIENLGISSARNILTRMGYAHGWRTADNMDKEYKIMGNTDFGPVLHMLQGVVKSARDTIIYDPDFHMLTNWEDSYEAEQHILHMGMADEPICWTLTGYVSGYCSRMFGREIYCIEDQCCAKGDAQCHCETRTKEGWGDLIEPHLVYFNTETIDGVLHNITKNLHKTERRLHKLQQIFESEIHPSGIIAGSVMMRQTLKLAERIAKVESSVVVTGESGVGKELISRYIHNESSRVGRPFVAVNCSAVTETLLESEFFGHAKGAFTGADKERAGLFETAAGGTLFLDEIGEIPLNMQTKLLRALQEKEIRRVGEDNVRPVNVRIIAATNRDIRKEVEEGRFREDLYYRLCIFELEVPPLRERTEDISPLARFFLDKLAQSMRRHVIGFTPEVVDLLEQYDWPGNVRQLQNTIEHAVALCDGKRIQVGDLPKNLRNLSPGAGRSDIIRPLDDVERQLILSAIQTVKGDKALAAKKLGISLSSLYQKLKKYEESGHLR